MLDTSYYRLSKPTGYTPPRANPHVNCGLWVIVCQCKFILCNQCTTPTLLIVRGVGVAVGAGVFGNFLYFGLTFVMNLKLLYKIKFIFKMVKI